MCGLVSPSDIDRHGSSTRYEGDHLFRGRSDHRLAIHCGARPAFPLRAALPYRRRGLCRSSQASDHVAPSADHDPSYRYRCQSCCESIICLTAIKPADKQIPVFLIDSWAYGRPTFPMMNIITYNLFSDKGANLYGTSPATFYLQNLFLNFNYLLPFALISLPALVVTYYTDRRRLGKTQQAPKEGETSPYTLLSLRLAPFYIWLAIITLQSHKEERFAFPLYPLLCFNAAVGVYLVKGWMENAYVTMTKSPYRVSTDAGKGCPS